MKKIITTFALVFCSILIVSCRDSSNSSSQANNITATKINSETVSATPVKQSTNSTTKNNKSQEIANDNPIVGTIKDMQNGDLKCYVNIVDVNGKLYEGVGAAFEVCDPEKYVNKNVRMSYELENVSDCQSAEPCGKTVKEWLITKIEILGDKSLDEADSATPVKQSTNSTTKNNKSQEIANDNPIVGTIKDMQNGDLKCYVNIVDVNGKLYEGVGAAFEVCQPEKYVNKNVRMSYELESVSDCQSAEPCGKTVKEWLITKIEILN